MRWIVVGGQGMLGQDLIATLEARGHEAVSIDRTQVDITDAAATIAVIADADVVVNCAAWTAVDSAEDHEPEAFAVNAVGAANVARAAVAAGARLVQISTDYVFAGHATEPYLENAPIAPASAYGRTKAAGEWAVRAEASDAIIVRTAWLYGAHGPCFPKTMARLGSERPELTVVDDQQGQPTWTVDLSDLIVRLIEADAPGGIYHGTSSGAVTWFGFATAILAASGAPATVQPVSSAAFASKAQRPSYSVLSHAALDAIGVAPIGDWRERWNAAASTVLGA